MGRKVFSNNKFYRNKENADNDAYNFSGGA